MTLELRTFNEALAELLSEVLSGPDKPYTWVVSHDPDAGVLGTLAKISAASASRPVVEGGRTIAAHAEHLRFSLAYANAHFRGENPSPDFSASWSISTVNEDQWKQLQSSLRQEFEAARNAMMNQSDWSDRMMLTGAMAMVAHAAYHLGAIRQMVRWLAQPPDLSTSAD